MEKGEIRIVKLPTSDGHEQYGTRPAIILSDTDDDIAINRTNFPDKSNRPKKNPQQNRKTKTRKHRQNKQQTRKNSQPLENTGF